MAIDRDILPDAKATALERSVLEVIVELHPHHLTVTELALKIAEGRDECEEIAHAIRDLKGSGLLREIGVVMPTHAGLRAAELFML